MKTSRLKHYASSALGTTTLLATHSDAATVIQVGSQSYNTGLSGIGTVSVNPVDPGPHGPAFVTTSTLVYWGGDKSGVFQRGTSTQALTDFSGTYKQYAGISESGSYPTSGALLNSDDNWARLRSLDGTQEVWMQFDFGEGLGGSTGIVKIVYPSTVGQFATAAEASAATNQNVSAVPEPSSAFGLLALGASGLLIRRRFKAA
jgi:hypothetical protein